MSEEALTFAVRRRTEAPAVSAEVRARSVLTAEEILDAMRRWSDRFGEPPTMLDWEPARARRSNAGWRAERFEAGDWPTVYMVRRCFDSFSDAVAQAGLKARPAPRRLRANLADRSAVLEAVREWTRRYGDVPAMADWDPYRARQLGQDWRIARYNSGDWPSSRTVVNHFGSFGSAIRAAELTPRPRTPGDRRQARQADRWTVARARSAKQSGGIDDLAQALRDLAEARQREDGEHLHMALIDVAAVALAWAENLS